MKIPQKFMSKLFGGCYPRNPDPTNTALFCANVEGLPVELRIDTGVNK